MPGRVHHSAINARDFDASLRFYREGLGLEVMMDTEFDGDWQGLFGATATRLRSVFLGDPANPDSGIVELVGLEGTPDGPPPPDAPTTGFFLLSFFVGDTAEVLARLRDLGLGGEPRRIELPGPNDSTVVMATVRDPDGVLVELIGA
ncbi:MAG: VOC family protein [Actinobacteria bacterium]|nr:VOC family protein [Actinomycetota bacterium]